MKSQGQELTICQSWLGQLLESLDPTASAPGCVGWEEMPLVREILESALVSTVDGRRLD